MAYIYQITNNINGKIYIGKTEQTIEQRFKQHCYDAFRERNEKRPLYSAMRKYGIENFSIELIEETSNPEEREIFWIENKNSYHNGYNATLGGDGKRYLDYELIIKTYRDVQNIAETSRILNIDKTTITKILKQNNITVLSTEIVNQQKRKFIIQQIDKTTNEVLNQFATYKEAARAMLEQKHTNCNFNTGSTHISEVCRNKRKTFAGFKWKNLNL